MQDFNLFGVLSIILAFIFLVVIFSLFRASKKLYKALKSKG